MITSMKYTVQLSKPGAAPEDKVELVLETDFDYDGLPLTINGEKYFIYVPDLLAVSAAVQKAYDHYSRRKSLQVCCRHC